MTTAMNSPAMTDSQTAAVKSMCRRSQSQYAAERTAQVSRPIPHAFFMGALYSSKLPRSMRLPKISLTTKIFIGLVLGVLLGWLKPEWGMAVRPLSPLFLALIKWIISPLIFATLVISIAGTGDIRQVGRFGVRPLVDFDVVPTVALVSAL